MAPATQRRGFLRCWLSSSSVVVLPHGGPWVVVVHDEEETVIQLVKWMRMPSSAATPVGVLVIVGGDGGGVSRSITSLDPREATIDDGAGAVCIPCWRH
jgi:hypothetical protein